jgi:hypothetical protein
MRHFYVGFGPDCEAQKGPCKGDTDPALTLENVTVVNGNTHGGNGGSASGGGGGAAGMGGAIFNDQSTVSILNSTLANNSATGGDGGSGDSELDKSQSGRGGGGGGGLSGNGADPSGASGGSGGAPNGGSPSGGSGGFGGGGAGGDGYDCVTKGDDDDDEGDNGGSGGFGGGGGAGGEGTQFCFVKSHLGGDGGNGGFGGGGGGRGAQDANLSKGEAPAGEGGFGGGEGLQVYGGGGAGMGGAVFSWFGTVNVTNSTISNNTAEAGEAGCALSPVKGFCSPIKGRSSIARGLGGGIFMHDGTLDMNNTTMSSNAAVDGSSGVDDKGFGDNGDGGAVYIFDTTFDKSGAQVFIDNSILAESNADDDFDTNAGLTKGPDAKGDIGSGSNNIIRDNEGFDGGYITDDPFLGNLTDNGGPTDTHLPEGIPDGFSKGDQSAAIGGGNNATCEEEDQRHFIPRPVGPDCDIGSVEVGAASDDGDDVDAEVEDGAPNDGDGNDDGTIDSIQPHVASLPAGAGGGYVTVEIIEDCPQLRNVMTVNAASLPPNVGADGAVKVYPHGLVEFEMPCESAIVEVTFHAAQNAGTGYDKYGPVTPGDVGTTAWYSFSDPGFATQTGPNVWTLDLEDGRLGDDTDGTDDTIFDQGGPFFPGGPIPAADWRGLLLLALLILSAGGLARRRRRSS